MERGLISNETPLLSNKLEVTQPMDTSLLHDFPAPGADLYWLLLEAKSLRDLAELVARVPEATKGRHMEWLSAELRIVQGLRDVRCGLVILSQAQALMGPGWARRQADAGKAEWDWILAEKQGLPKNEARRTKDQKYNGSTKGLKRKALYRATLKSGGAR